MSNYDRVRQRQKAPLGPAEARILAQGEKDTIDAWILERTRGRVTIKLGTVVAIDSARGPLRVAPDDSPDHISAIWDDPKNTVPDDALGNRVRVLVDGTSHLAVFDDWLVG